MKNIFLLLAIAIATVSCQNTECQPQKVDPADLVTLDGEFLYLADAAVLKGDNFIYGVTLDCMMDKLAKQVESAKGDEFDMVPVTIKGSLTRKVEGAEGWDEIITINEIVNVSKTPSEADIKIEENKS